MYHNKVEKSNAVEALRERLEEARITASTRQICDKLTTLRNYYGAVKRKSDSLKRQGFEGDEAYYCRWQFYQPLSFLEGTFSPRTGTEYPRKQLPYVMDNTMSILPSDRSLPSIQISPVCKLDLPLIWSERISTALKNQAINSNTSTTTSNKNSSSSSDLLKWPSTILVKV